MSTAPVRQLVSLLADPSDNARALRILIGSLLWFVASIVVVRADERAMEGGMMPRTALGEPRGVGRSKSMGHGEPQRQAPFLPGRSPYATGLRQRPKYFVPPTLPRTPTWPVYGTQPGVRPGDWPTYAPLGMGGYRFPAVGNQAYR
jgi:hypothetical protein